jgi:hypothetical protein
MRIVRVFAIRCQNKSQPLDFGLEKKGRRKKDKNNTNEISKKPQKQQLAHVLYQVEFWPQKI